MMRAVRRAPLRRVLSLSLSLSLLLLLLSLSLLSHPHSFCTYRVAIDKAAVQVVHRLRVVPTNLVAHRTRGLAALRPLPPVDCLPLPFTPHAPLHARRHDTHGVRA